MDLTFAVVLQVLAGIATLLIISLGLAVIFGMMRVINLAHGEFLMLGGYATILSERAGASIWIAILLVPPIVVGLVGFVIERLLIRRLYGRMVDTMLGTWGLSLALIGGVTMVFGDSITGISAPLGSVPIGRFRISGYSLFLIATAAALVIGTWLVLRFTRLGLIARGTMQNPEVAATLGVSPAGVYAITFTMGAALSGLAGGLIAPLSGVFPTMGAAYIAKAFITVITGGSTILAGTVSAAALLGAVSMVATFLTTPIFGEVALLIVAIVLLRLLPRGITGRFLRRVL
jgi:branched-subunit amino acid ABC-type transport system permease component